MAASLLPVRRPDGSAPLPAAPDEALLRRLTGELLADVERLAAEVSARVLRRHPDLAALGDADLDAALGRSTTANVGAALSTLAFGVPAASVDPPEGAFELVQVAARIPDGLAVLLRAYRLGAAETWQRVAEHLGAHVHDAGTLARLMLVASAHINTYTDHVSHCLTERFSELTRAIAVADRRREAALRALLRGGPPHTEAIDHPFDRFHVAVAARVTPDSPLRSAQRALLPARGWFAGSPTVELTEPDGTQLAWFSPRDRPTDPQLERLIPAEGGVHLAVSHVGYGIDGFVTVAREARDTLRALTSLHPDGAAGSYRAHALLATLLADPERALRLAIVVLGPLAGQSREARRLRETLRAYFSCQENKTATGGLLGIHEKTVAYRLRHAARLLGEPIQQRRAELEAALLVLETRCASVSALKQRSE